MTLNFLDQPPPPRAQDAPGAPKDLRLLVVCAWLMIGLGGLLVLIGLADTPEPSTTQGQVQDVVRLEQVGADKNYRYYYEIVFGADGNPKTVTLYSRQRLDVGGEVELNVDAGGARLSTGSTSDGLRAAGFMTAFIGLAFLIYGLRARRRVRKPQRHRPEDSLSSVPAQTPTNAKLAIGLIMMVTLGGTWAGNTIQYWSYGEGITTPIVSTELLGAEAGVRVEVELTAVSVSSP